MRERCAAGDDLPMSAEMVLQPPDGQVPLECPEACQKPDRRDDCTSEHENVHVPFGVGSRFAQEKYPGQEERGRDENAEITLCSHGCLAKSQLAIL